MEKDPRELVDNSIIDIYASLKNIGSSLNYATLLSKSIESRLKRGPEYLKFPSNDEYETGLYLSPNDQSTNSLMYASRGRIDAVLSSVEKVFQLLHPGTASFILEHLSPPLHQFSRKEEKHLSLYSPQEELEQDILFYQKLLAQVSPAVLFEIAKQLKGLVKNIAEYSQQNISYISYPENRIFFDALGEATTVLCGDSGDHPFPSLLEATEAIKLGVVNDPTNPERDLVDWDEPYQELIESCWEEALQVQKEMFEAQEAALRIAAGQSISYRLGSLWPATPANPVRRPQLGRWGSSRVRPVGKRRSRP